MRKNKKRILNELNNYICTLKDVQLMLWIDDITKLKDIPEVRDLVIWNDIVHVYQMLIDELVSRAEKWVEQKENDCEEPSAETYHRAPSGR